jgi:dienelactone hydrolase
MRAILAASIALLMVGCGFAGAAGPSPASGQPPAAALPAQLSSDYGSYRTADGGVFVIARLGWFFDVANADYRTIYDGGAANRFIIGPAFAQPLPKFADLTFQGETLTIAGRASRVIARRIDYRETQVQIAAKGATLAGAITEPLGEGPTPGIVIVHGAEPGERYFYDVWVGVYAGLGLTVLTYDKRGLGASTGRYPGEYPSEAALATYADDASAALDFLRAWPRVDPRRVGFHGGSQGGWTVPLAIRRHDGASFAILASASATTVDATDLWAGFSGGGASMPGQSEADMEATVRATHSGFDPASALAALAIPTLWLLGTNDRTVPTAVCVEILTAMDKPNFTIHLLPTGHALLVNPTGLLADDDRSAGLAPDLVPTLASWLGANA